MNYQKIIKRSDGTKVGILVDVRGDYFGGSLDWEVRVSVAMKGKRTFVPVVSGDDYSFRRLTPDQKLKHCKEKSLLVVSEQEVLDALTEAWQKARPTFQDAFFRVPF